jgi:hypothetical protein
MSSSAWEGITVAYIVEVIYKEEPIAKPQTPAKETARDGRFIAYDNGTVLDTGTNLMWAARTNAEGTTWQSARSYCENYRGGGYTDWRMPTQDELAKLYNPNKSQTTECGIFPSHVGTDLIHLTCWWVWASATLGSDAAGFNFGGGRRIPGPQSDVDDGRALPVRSGK